MGNQIMNIVSVLAPKALISSASAANPNALKSSQAFSQILQQAFQAPASGGGKINLKSIPPQLLALIQSGMPLSLVANQIAHSLAGKVATALSNGAQNLVSDLAKNKMVQAFASALAPPGGSPPGSSAEIASTLAQRLQQLVADVAGAAGQQNRISGTVLDANSAKEIPAQQRNAQLASSDPDVVSFVESVIADAAAQLQTSANGNSAPPSSGAGTRSTLPVLMQNDAQAPGTVSTLPLLTQNDAQAPGTVSTLPLLMQNLAQAAGTLHTMPQLIAAAQTATLSATSQPQPVSILGRIIARAATASANLSGSQTAAAVSAGTSSQNKSVSSVVNTPVDALRVSLDSLVSSIVDAAKNSGGNASGQNPGAFGWNLAQNVLAQTADGNAPQSSDGVSFATQASALLGGTTATAAVQGPLGSAAGPLAPYTTIDANSIIDQVVKGFVVRTFGQNNSEVRMRLSPENLGDVSLKLSVVGGNITASITAQNTDVRDALLSNQNLLAKSLADAGMKLANFSVNVSGGGPNGFSQHQQLAQQAGVRRIGFDIGGTDEGQDDVLAATPTFGPPLVGATKLGLLNYLA